ncbi:MAG: GNAT family N-acetyltransferase [Candidatus Sericytochromatia bacterium]
MTIHHSEDGSHGRFYLGDPAHPDAEMTYSRSSAHLIIIDHTEVDPSHRGEGLGDALVGEMVSWARASGTKVIPLCPFTKSRFDKQPVYRDVLA